MKPMHYASGQIRPAVGRRVPLRATCSRRCAAVRCQAARDDVLSYLANGEDMYSKNPAFAAQIEKMIEEAGPTQAKAALDAGSGTWKVFWAPHISTMSATLLGTKFQPILYHFGQDGSLSSNVKYANPLLGTGWLSASGSMSWHDDTSVSINFTEFWVDVGDNLRTSPPGSSDPQASTLDTLITQVGRAAFLPSWAVFPVLYMDSDLAVFKFPPLDSKIAIVKQ